MKLFNSVKKKYLIEKIKLQELQNIYKKKIQILLFSKARVTQVVFEWPK